MFLQFYWFYIFVFYFLIKFFLFLKVLSEFFVLNPITAGKFENQNNIGINVYGYEDKKLFPLHITIAAVARHHVNLSYITAFEKSH